MDLVLILTAGIQIGRGAVGAGTRPRLKVAGHRGEPWEHEYLGNWRKVLTAGAQIGRDARVEQQAFPAWPQVALRVGRRDTGVAGVPDAHTVPARVQRIEGQRHTPSTARARRVQGPCHTGTGRARKAQAWSHIPFSHIRRV